MLEEEDLVERARTTGDHVTERLLELQTRHRLIGDVRCPGLFAAIELVRDRETKEPAARRPARSIRWPWSTASIFGTSRYAGLGNVVKFKPPLTISRDEVDRAIDVLDTVLTQIEASH